MFSPFNVYTLNYLQLQNLSSVRYGISMEYKLSLMISRKWQLIWSKIFADLERIFLGAHDSSQVFEYFCASSGTQPNWLLPVDSHGKYLCSGVASSHFCFLCSSLWNSRQRKYMQNLIFFVTYWMFALDSFILEFFMWHPAPKVL